MINRRIGQSAALVLLASLAACVSAPPPPPPAPAPQPAPPPAPQLPADWRDWPVAPGDWSYLPRPEATFATFGLPGQPPILALRCERATRRITVARAMQAAPGSVQSAEMVVRTSHGTAQWPATTGAVPGLAGSFSVATRLGSDAALDQMAFSRGRFAIEAPGATPIAVPSWAEVSRVIEDCR